MRFDPTRPHGLVYGQPGVAFEQGGVFFRPDGKPVESPHGRVVEMPPAPPAAPEPQPAAPAVEPPAQDDVDLDKSPQEMNDKELRALVETFGEEWKGRKAAIAFFAPKSGKEPT
jgi:hypothetical protein